MNLFSYAQSLTEKAGKTIVSGDVFAKILTSNDDSGRHGVLIPGDAYLNFPELQIHDETQNATLEFQAFNTVSKSLACLAYKYYQRYPERRITRLPATLNEPRDGKRLFIFLRAKHSDGAFAYYYDAANSGLDDRFDTLFHLIFGNDVLPTSGNFIIRPVSSPAFVADHILEDLLSKFDNVKRRGWIDSMRTGDTGIGYTFETLLGLKENNDQTADFHGIEIKCKGVKEGTFVGSSKINLFQSGPTWLKQFTSRELIRTIGAPGADGLYSCYSQITTSSNNRGLSLNIAPQTEEIRLNKISEPLGYWTYNKLEKRLIEKHSRAVFVKTKIRSPNGPQQFLFDELIYCEQPSIDRFITLVEQRNIVFELTMSEKTNGSIRNHGYPWRLIREQLLDQLFAFQIKLR